MLITRITFTPVSSHIEAKLMVIAACFYGTNIVMETFLFTYGVKLFYDMCKNALFFGSIGTIEMTCWECQHGADRIGMAALGVLC